MTGNALLWHPKIGRCDYVIEEEKVVYIVFSRSNASNEKNSIVTTLSFKDSMIKMMVEGSTPYH